MRNKIELRQWFSQRGKVHKKGQSANISKRVTWRPPKIGLDGRGINPMVVEWGQGEQWSGWPRRVGLRGTHRGGFCSGCQGRWWDAQGCFCWWQRMVVPRGLCMSASLWDVATPTIWTYRTPFWMTFSYTAAWQKESWGGSMEWRSAPAGTSSLIQSTAERVSLLRGPEAERDRIEAPLPPSLDHSLSLWILSFAVMTAPPAPHRAARFSATATWGASRRRLIDGGKKEVKTWRMSQVQKLHQRRDRRGFSKFLLSLKLS